MNDMALKFSWSGIKSGSYDKGEIIALNREDAAYLLKKQGVVISSLEQVSHGNKEANATPKVKKKKKSKKVPLKQLILFTKKLQTMLIAGLSIVRILKMLEEQTKEPMLSIVTSIREDVEQGKPMAQSFQKHPNVFDTVFINMVKAGEASGQLENFFGKIIEYLERQASIRKKIKAALTYPMVLLTVATGVVAVMLIFVVPVFQDIFKSSGSELPGPTQAVVAISETLREPLIMLPFLATIAGIIFAHKTMMKKSAPYKKRMHKIQLRTPIIKDMILNSNLAKIAMIQGNLYEAGVSLVESIDISSDAVENMVIKESLTEVKKGVFSGKNLSSLYREFPKLYPPTFVALIEVGEQSGILGNMFNSVSEYFAKEFDQSVGAFTSILEPIMIVFMGITIGFILIAMYAPMFSMGSAI